MDTGGGVGIGEGVIFSKKMWLAPNELEMDGQWSQMEAKEPADKKRWSRQDGRDGGRRRNYSPPRDKSHVAVMNLSCGDMVVPSRDLIRCSLSGLEQHKSSNTHKKHTCKINK